MPRASSRRRTDVIEAPAYAMRDAARWVAVPESTVRAWCHGRRSRSKAGAATFEPVLALDDSEGKFLSFRNLVELHVLTAIRRQYGVSLQNTRRAVSFMEGHLGIDHPLASRRMLTDGKDLLVREGSQLLNASKAGQLELDIVSAFLERIEFDRAGNLQRLYPFSTPKLEDDPRAVVVDPRVQFGRPCIFGSGVPTEVLLERFEGGESIGEIAADYGLDPGSIEGAIRFETRRAA